MKSGRLDINLLGTTFSIQADESDEYLKSIYDYYVNCVKKVETTVGRKLEPIKISIIAGILLSDELKKTNNYLKQLTPDQQVDYQLMLKTKELIEKLDSVLPSEQETDS